MTAYISSVSPVLASLNLDETRVFYTEKLGFELDGQHDDYLTVKRDGFYLHFWLCDERHIAENTSCYIHVENPQAFYEEFSARGLKLRPPVTRSWGMTELYVIDPHGNLIKYGASATKHQVTAVQLDNPKVTYHAVVRLKKLNNLRQRDIAEQLSISECEVVASRCNRTDDELGQVTRLNCDSDSRIALFNALPSVGKVMVLTRNESVVHERKGTFETVQVGAKMGLVLGADIDLRLFFSQWQYAFAVTDAGERTLHSIQFFDAYGMAIQKIYATTETDLVAFQALIQNHKAVHQDGEVSILNAPEAEPKTDLSTVDQAQFKAEWLAITDVHQFFGLLKTHGLTRTQAYSIAPEGYAQAVAPSIMAQALELAAEQTLPIMVFVGNRGAIQIHTGAVHNLKRMGNWYNVLDPDFNLHIKEDQIAKAWIIKRPSADGVITSIDFFDVNDNQIMTFFGQRRQNEAELPAWAALVAQLQGAHSLETVLA